MTPSLLAKLVNLPVSLLLLASAAILLILGCCKLNKFAASLYFSLSLPGALLSAFMLWLFVRQGYASYPVFIVQAAIYCTFNPGTWIFPIVLCKQIYNLGVGHFAPASKATWIGCGLLAGLYPWWDLMEALWQRIGEAFS